MDNRPENESKEKIHHLEMDCHQVPLLLPAVKEKAKLNINLPQRKNTYNETCRH
jgi:hypothetical protein